MKSLVNISQPGHLSKNLLRFYAPEPWLTPNCNSKNIFGQQCCTTWRHLFKDLGINIRLCAPVEAQLLISTLGTDKLKSAWL